MKTRIIRACTGESGPGIRRAARALRGGGLVAFPTETVYGLGANAMDSQAVAGIFKAKGRPQDNPLISHIAGRKGLEQLVDRVPRKAEDLMSAFWPGPLTLVLEKSREVPEATTGGLPTVAVRMPANDIALALIREADVPVAAPSANLSGSPSPTCARHVLDDLDGRIDYVIDGGKTRIGVESTVLDLTADTPRILRPGGITHKMLLQAVGEVEEGTPGGRAKSPGMKYRHYSPKARLILAEGHGKTQMLAERYMEKNLKVGVIATDGKTYNADTVKKIGETHEEIARNLYQTLRKLDEEQVDIIIAQTVKDQGLGHAIMNRLKKAQDK